MSSNRKVSVKIVIERDANPARIPRSLQDFGVLSLIQTDLAHVDRIDATFREQDPGRAEPRSCDAVDPQTLVIHRGSGVAQCLIQVLWFEKRVVCDDRSPVRVRGQQLQHTPNCDPHAPKTGLPATLARFNGNPVKRAHCRHAFSVNHANKAGFRRNARFRVIYGVSESSRSLLERAPKVSSLGSGAGRGRIG